MAKGVGECFLCGEEGKGKRFTYYSGERHGGSRTELMSMTVTVSEWWKELMMHEAFACRECQKELWAEHVKWPPIICGAGAGVALAVAVPFPIFGGLFGLAVCIMLVIVALAAGGAGLWLYTEGKKTPDREKMEPLLVRAAAEQSIDRGRTFMTTAHYLDLVERGIIG